ncbi:hypothetical protein SEA_EASTWEST_64 [Arthrobacter phage EastWest]|uniref:Uncharacterized protein n=1 Tax=Arthrobacter phage EastWest TaxID=2894292 RepID=A0AAE8YP46_9CAUD|nr:hypothetical protein SEA_EASTWEST_64 [Arthrobacter phage EastWest]
MPNIHMREATLGAAQLADEETNNEAYLAEQGITDETMQFSALHRVAESNLAIAYEQRTANMIAFLALAQKQGWADDDDAKLLQVSIIEALDLAELKELIK